jgi:rhodanese-related sulfurtransferase
MPVARISKEDLKQRLEADAASHPTVVDARLKYAFEHSTVKLPGSLRAAPGESVVSRVPRDRDVVVYDSDPDEVTAREVATALIRQGYRACVLKGGIAEWVTANFPIETKDSPRPAPPAGAAKA